MLLLEGGTADTGRVVVSLLTDSQVVWSDTLTMVSTPGSPASALLALPVRRLPPGPGSLEVRRPKDGTIRTASLYAGLSPEWVPRSWVAAVDQLRYALDGDTLRAWRDMPPPERSAAWERFQERTDFDPATPGNEYLQRYFERMSLANDRYAEGGRAGWESDRGQVLVRLGEPDRQRFIRPERQGEVPRLEWEYEESVPGRALIVFEDASDFGVYVLTPRSRAVVRRLERERADLERAERLRVPG
jgi:GWxTD domain-containing protein